MRLTAFTDYGLRMLMLMAGAPGQMFTAAELAAQLDLRRSHLSKIMLRLAQGGIISTRPGRGGGAMLARAPDSIRLGEVVRLLEQGQPLVACFQVKGGQGAIQHGCGLRLRLKRAETSFLNDLNRSTLADIAWQPAGGDPAAVA